MQQEDAEDSDPILQLRDAWVCGSCILPHLHPMDPAKDPKRGGHGLVKYKPETCFRAGPDPTSDQLHTNFLPTLKACVDPAYPP